MGVVVETAAVADVDEDVDEGPMRSSYIFDMSMHICSSSFDLFLFDFFFSSLVHAVK